MIIQGMLMELKKVITHFKQLACPKEELEVGGGIENI